MARVEYILDRDIFGESIKMIAGKRLVVDLGSGTRFHKDLSGYKSLFKDIRYFALDIRFHPALDIVADAENLPLKDNCANAVICSGVIHLAQEPQKAAWEIYRILDKEGVAFISLPFLYPYHGSKVQKDFYRFTKDGLEYIFRDFSEMKIQPRGGYINTSFNFMTGFKIRNKFFMQFLEKPLSVLISILRRKAINRLHNPIGFNILLRK